MIHRSRGTNKELLDELVFAQIETNKDPDHDLFPLVYENTPTGVRSSISPQPSH